MVNPSTEKINLSKFFLQRLLGLLENRGWSQKEFAKRAHLSQAAVSKYFNKGALPGMQELDRIAKAFSVPLDYFIEDFREQISAALLHDRDPAAEHLVDDVMAEAEKLIEQAMALTRAVDRLKKGRKKGAGKPRPSSPEAETFARRAIDDEQKS